MPDSPDSLLNLMLAEIRQDGPLPFSRFQELALYHPEWGYYARGRAPGREGADFWTAPEMDPAFGELIGRQVREMAARLGEPDGFRVVEHGAGTGSLAAALLDSWRRGQDPLLRSGVYRIVETSPALRRVQQERLAEHGDVVTWEDAEQKESTAGAGVVLMNEVLDALPVDRVVGSPEALREIRVGEEQGALVEVRVPAALDLAAATEALLPPDVPVLPDGHELEICRELEPFIRGAAERITRGYLLIIDYGHTTRERLHPARSRGTVMAYAGHQATEQILDRPGGVDLTSHVDWDALESAATAAGFTPSGRVRQLEFLMALGLGEMVEKLETLDLPEPERVRRRLALASLVRPGGMGEMFQVFIAGREASPALTGLRSPWQAS